VVNAGPAETVGEFPLYFTELVEQADKNLRTVADRDHRAVTGYSAGGFMAFWTAGKYPDLVGSASSLMGPTEYTVGPKGFDVEYSCDDFYANYDGIRTWLVTGSRDFLQFYHRRLNAIWSFAGPAGIGVEPVVSIVGYDLVDAAWLTAGKPVKLRVKLLNKGGGRLPTLPVQWESPNAGVKFDAAPARLFGLAPGETASLPLSLTVSDPARTIVKLVAVVGGTRLPLVLPLFPAAEPTKDFQIADGRKFKVIHHANQPESEALGEGNGDGFAAPGETFAVLLPDGDAYRAVEVFTADPCVDTSLRVSDTWVNYDHSGASVKYSLLRIQSNCQPGTPVHMLARVVMPNAPNHQVRYYSLEFPVWYRNEK
jgi:hypothetical protein